MARMIPVDCDLSQRPYSERVVFDATKKNLSDEWYVFHSFDYVTRDQKNKRWDGEIDFLLYHPAKGLLVIEVKGGAISHRQGQWYQEDRPIDPVVQAKKNIYAVLDLLKDRLKQSVIPLRHAHCVCFPGCVRQTVWPPEAAGLVLTLEDLPYIEKIATRILMEVKVPENLCSVTTKDILRTLTPEFEYGRSLTERICIEEERFFRLTEQQCALLDMLEDYKRLLIQGCAGSGKTLMALKQAQRLAGQGKRVLLLCYNKLLTNLLQEATKDIFGIEAVAFYDFCVTLMKISDEEMRQPDIFKQLPERLMTYLDRNPLTYDAIIVDEGQDFSADSWDVIEMMLAPEGNFYIFFDPDQNIFQKELELPQFGNPPVKLTRNCRNTRRIFEALKPYLSLEAKSMEEIPEGSKVRDLSGSVPQLLEKELERLLVTEKIPATDIVILGARSLKNTSIADFPKIGGFTVVENPEAPGKQQIAYHTYMKFKGCESKVVILIDVDESHKSWRRNGLYTAMSRGVHQLIILRTKQ